MYAQKNLVFSSLASKIFDNMMMQVLLTDSTMCCYSVEKVSLRNTSLLLGDRFRKLSIFQVMHHYVHHGHMLLAWNFSILMWFCKGVSRIAMVLGYDLNSIIIPCVGCISCIFYIAFILVMEVVKLCQET